MTDEQTEYVLTGKGLLVAIITKHVPAITLDECDAIIADGRFHEAILNYALEEGLIYEGKEP